MLKIIEFLLNLVFPPSDEKTNINFENISINEIYRNCKRSRLNHCAFSYKEPVIKELIHQMKFGGNKRCAEICGIIVSKEIKKHISKNKDLMLVPIPIHRKRRNERGFNQCERMCETILREINTDYQPKLLIRHVYRKRQSCSDKKERIKQIAGVFKINQKILKKVSLDSEILLIDDVVTTGATISEARKTLTSVGFKRIRIFAIAH